MVKKLFLDTNIVADLMDPVFGFGKSTLEEAVALSLQEEADLEDILQCLCAKNNDCEMILTHDIKFYDCGIALLKPQEFLEK